MGWFIVGVATGMYLFAQHGEVIMACVTRVVGE
jgi:hypothetical protein